MRILDRYLASAVIGGTLLTLGVLVPLLGFFILADEIDDMGSAQYGFGGLLMYILLRLPDYAYRIFPLATLIGALVGLGSLASRSELVAMRAAGISVPRIVGAALRGGVVLAIMALILGEVVVPAAEQRAATLHRQVLSGDVAQQTPDGFWAIDEGSYVNIREILSGTSLRDISIFQVDPQKGTLVSTHAQGAQYHDDGWELQQISRSTASSAGVKVEHIDHARWESMLDPALLKVVIADPRVLPVWGLYKYIRFMHVNHQDARLYEVTFWNKVVQPLLTLSMIFVAIPVLLGSARTTGLGRRMFIGVLLGILYYVISQTFGYLALLFGMSAFLAAATPPVLFVLGAYVLLRRVG